MFFRVLLAAGVACLPLVAGADKPKNLPDSGMADLDAGSGDAAGSTAVVTRPSTDSLAADFTHRSDTPTPAPPKVQRSEGDMRNGPRGAALSTVDVNGVAPVGSSEARNTGAWTDEKPVHVDSRAEQARASGLNLRVLPGTHRFEFVERVNLTVEVERVPLPGSALLLLTGLGSLAALRRRAS